jgi:hypothetical protein
MIITFCGASRQIISAGQASYSQKTLQKNDVRLRKVSGRMVNRRVRPHLKTSNKSITYIVPNFWANILNSMKMLGLCD